MANKLVSVVTGGSNSHQTSSAEINGIATDFISQGVVGAVSNTSGVAPSTGAFAVNAIGTPNMSVRVTNGVAYVTATPTGGTSQTFRVTMDATEDVTIAANATGGTRYDWIYIKLDADKLVNPAVAADDVFTLAQSRSTSASTDNGTPPTYGYKLAVVTVSNGATSITNSNITDGRTRTGANMLADSVTLPTTTVVNSKSFYNPYKFSAYRTAALTPGAADIIWDTELFDTNSNFDTSTGKYTCPVSGFYQFNATLGFSTAAANLGYGVCIKKNGVTQTSVRAVMMYIGAYVHVSAVSVVVQATAGDYFTVSDVAGSGRPLDVGLGTSSFSGFLVSTT